MNKVALLLLTLKNDVVLMIFLETENIINYFLYRCWNCIFTTLHDLFKYILYQVVSNLKYNVLI